MAWMIGIDEAGYGPNYGPLVVAASAWWVDEEAEGGERRAEGGERRAEGRSCTAVLASRRKQQSSTTCLYRRLSKIVSRTASERKLAIADSKQLYKPGLGLRQLERGVLVGLSACTGEPSASAPGLGEPSASAPGVLARWKSLMHKHAPPLPFYADYECDLPIDATQKEIDRLSKRFETACGLAGVELVDLRVRLVYPSEFNELTAHFGNKAGALSHVSVGLLREVMDYLATNSPDLLPGLATRAFHVSGGSARTYVTCDKHGGRDYYGALLQHYFPEEWIDTLVESEPVSRYAWGPEDSRIEVCFRVEGEAELPVALASMTAKYHRELAMRAFNAFWCERIPDLRPTAGYPTDSKRFKKAISALQTELEIDDNCLWRWR